MKAIFLAAGSGTRLGHYTKEIPKGLVDINGQSILERQINLLRKNNITDISIVRGYKKEKFPFKDIEYFLNSEYKETEQVSSMMTARSKITGDTIIIFGDIIFDESVLKQVLSSKDDIAIAIDLEWEKSYDERPDNPKSKADKVLINGNKVIQVSAKKISPDQDKQNIGELLGILKLSPVGSITIKSKYEQLEKSHVGEFHDAISLKKAKLVDILQELLNQEIKISPITVNGEWCEIDTINDLQRARKLFT